MHGSPLRVLLIDDSEPDLALATEAIKQWEEPCEIEMVSGGEKALDFLYRRNGYDAAPEPDLILLDLNMPEPDGFAILETIKQDAHLRRIPVIVFASTGAPQKINRAYRLGANSFGPKPMTWEEYSHTLKQIGRFWIKTVSLPRENRAVLDQDSFPAARDWRGKELSRIER